jgi:hypothetical protein
MRPKNDIGDDTGALAASVRRFAAAAASAAGLRGFDSFGASSAAGVEGSFASDLFGSDLFGSDLFGSDLSVSSIAGFRASLVASLEGSGLAAGVSGGGLATAFGGAPSEAGAGSPDVAYERSLLTRSSTLSVALSFSLDPVRA